MLDITDYMATHKFIKAYKPEVIIHCAAYTAVDKAENDVECCRRVNAQGTENIAKVCQEIAAKLVYISTDYIFPGVGEQFYEVDDETGPTNVYGLTKLEGEQKVRALLTKYFIVRISWVFGRNGNNFVKTMLKLGENHAELNVVADQIGSPTYTADLAPLLCAMVFTDKYGTYHVTNEGVCFWAEFAREIFAQAGMSVKVNPIPASEYPTRATRPYNSRMSKAKLTKNGFSKLPAWQDALARYLKEIGKSKKPV
jgi:dTDP-4-dehydrorhamnose reductase